MSRTWNKEDFIDAVKNNETKADVIRQLGMSAVSGGNYKTVDKYIDKYDLDPEFNHGNNGGGKARRPLDDVMTKDSYYNTSRLKERIIENNIIPYECAMCGNEGRWRGKELVLQLDHINGDNTDNRKENLRFLCPNCHTQTETWTGKNQDSKEDQNHCEKCGTEISKGASRCQSCAAKKRNKERDYDHPTKID